MPVHAQKLQFLLIREHAFWNKAGVKQFKKQIHTNHSTYNILPVIDEKRDDNVKRRNLKVISKRITFQMSIFVFVLIFASTDKRRQTTNA